MKTKSDGIFLGKGVDTVAFIHDRIEKSRVSDDEKLDGCICVALHETHSFSLFDLIF